MEKNIEINSKCGWWPAAVVIVVVVREKKSIILSLSLMCCTIVNFFPQMGKGKRGQEGGRERGGENNIHFLLTFWTYNTIDY